MNKRITASLLLLLATGTAQSAIDWSIFTRPVVPYTVAAAFGVGLLLQCKWTQTNAGEIAKRWLGSKGVTVILDSNNEPNHLSHNGINIDFKAKKTTFTIDHMTQKDSTFEVKEANGADPLISIKADYIVHEQGIGAPSHAQVHGTIYPSLLALCTKEANNAPKKHEHWRGGQQIYSIQNHWNIMPQQGNQVVAPRVFTTKKSVEGLIETTTLEVID